MKSSKQTFVYCTKHGVSGARGRAKCTLSQAARSAWLKHKERGDSLVITATSDAEEGHGAFCVLSGDSARAVRAKLELQHQLRVSARKRATA